MLQRSTTSGAFFFYPRVAEPGTGAQEWEWVTASGDGVVYASTIVRNRPPVADHVVALIDLAEGPRLMSRVEGIALEAVTIGMKVRARVGTIDGTPALLFDAAEDAA